MPATCSPGFAELVKSPEHIHTYRITPLSLWNAAAAGLTAKQILGRARASYSKYEIPQNIVAEIEGANRPLWPHQAPQGA
jgi:DNA excision repair protein ERCC-3